MLFLLALFWLGFTHLQSRFLILIVPICALLIAQLPWHVGIVIAAQALVAFVPLHLEFASLLSRFGEDLPQLIGTEWLGWVMQEEIRDKIPPDATLILVGDGKAFLYQRPMSRLRYRTIFDADTSNGRGIIEAWVGSDTAPAWLLIDPNELKRFESYQPFPPVPPSISQERQPFLVHR
jgi:hypothetical protein